MKSILSLLVTAAVAVMSTAAFAADGEYLVKMRSNGFAAKASLKANLPAKSQVEDLGGLGWYNVRLPKSAVKSFGAKALRAMPGVISVQPNYKVKLIENPSLKKISNDPETKGLADIACKLLGGLPAAQDNPEFPAVVQGEQGGDPLFGSQWGMMDIGVREAWKLSKGNSGVIVAVIDTGVDYTHEDLVENLWRNPGEMGTDAQGRDKSMNGEDDDGNGYIDDLLGWDFVSEDNKPFDLNVSCVQLLQGGNPGHGTHCAGNIAARGFNGKGIAGVAPNVSIMSLRFLGEGGQGDTAGAIKAIMYALNNGARVLSNSWGSIGEDPADPNNQALKDAIAEAEARGVLFVAAAGNGDPNTGEGYDNDTSKTPAFPASYPNDIIVSVAAIDAQDNLGKFSNWGPRSVDIGAPGVKVFSTVVGSGYSDTVLDLSVVMGSLPKITWDGTSMATPHVAGAAALYWSHRPNASWQEVKDALMRTAAPASTLQGKTASGGKLNVEALMNY
jgi:thermitase